MIGGVYAAAHVRACPEADMGLTRAMFRPMLKIGTRRFGHSPHLAILLKGVNLLISELFELNLPKKRSGFHETT
jgi:hypothetical protein